MARVRARPLSRLAHHFGFLMNQTTLFAFHIVRLLPLEEIECQSIVKNTFLELG